MRNIDIFKATQEDMFDYYCTMAQHLNIKELKCDKKIEITILLVSKTRKHETESLTLGDFKFVARTINVTGLKANTFRGMYDELTCLAVFIDCPKVLENPVLVKGLERCVERYESLSENIAAPVPRWPYFPTRGLRNLTPPLLPDKMPILSVRDLKAYCMLLDNSYEITNDMLSVSYCRGHLEVFAENKDV